MGRSRNGTDLFFCLISGTVFAKQWESIGLRSKTMKNAGIGSGEGEQYQTGLDMSKSDPNILYACFDVGHIEKSKNGGDSLEYILQNGFKAGTAYFVAIHPSDTNIVYAYGNYVQLFWGLRQNDSLCISKFLTFV